MHSVLIWAFVALVGMPWAGAPAFARSMESGDAFVAQNATPAVVNIATWKMRPAATAGDPPRRVKTYGSGFIIDPAGIIVTNKHVIDGAISVNVLFSDGNRASASLLAVAGMADLAVLKVTVDRPLPILKWGNGGTLRVGDAVLAIGNPLGLGLSVSAGIVSALNRDIQDTPFDNYIQTDAAINHGNSGGPMVDLKGDVVGVDTALYNPDEVGGFIGIGLAIPSDTAKFVVDRLLDPQPSQAGLARCQAAGPDAGAIGRAGPARPQGLDHRGGGPGRTGRPRQRSGQATSFSALGGVKPSDTRAFMREIIMIPVGQPARTDVWRDGKE